MSARAGRGPRALAAVGLAGLLAGSLLLFPRGSAAHPRGAPLRVLVVDASDSVRRPRPGWLRWVRERVRREAEDADAAGLELALVTYARDVSRAYGPGPARDFLRRVDGVGGPGAEGPFDPRPGAGPDDATHLAGALAAAEALVLGEPRPGPGTEVLLVGDADWTGESPLPALERLRRGGVGLRHVAPPPPELWDAALRELRLPDPVEPEAPLAARFTVELRRGTAPAQELALDVRVDNGGRVTRRVLPLALPPGTTGPGRSEVLEASFALGAAGLGRTEVEARVVLGDGGHADACPENDVARATTRSRGALVAGVVAAERSTEAAAAWLTPSGTSALPGIDVVHLRPEELATSAGGLDVVVSFDVPTTELAPDTLADFVLRGGGWLALSGWDFLEAWIPGSEPEGAGRLLPLRPAPGEQPPRDVLLLVDGSGSMAGEPFEAVRAAALDLVGAALPADRVALRFFTVTLEPEIPIKERGDADSRARRREAAERLLDARVPGGSTWILSSLERLADERAGGSVETLALLLTDGRDGEPTASRVERASTLLDRFAAERTRLVPIGVGERLDTGFLDLLVRGGERWTRARDLDDLRSVFRRELVGARWREGPALAVRAVPPATGSLAAEIGAPRGSLPPVERYLRCELAPGAEALWVSDEGEPLLAVQRRGLGRVAQLATVPDRDWASAYTGRFGLGEPAEFGALLRFLGRPTEGLRHAGGRDAPRVELARDGSGGEERLRLLDLPDTAWDVPARLADEAQGEPRFVAELVFHPSLRTPGEDPRRVRTAELTPAVRERLSGPGLSLSVGAVGPAGPGEDAGRVLGVGPFVPAEYGAGARRVPPELLEGPPAELAAPAATEAPAAHPAGPWLLAAGLLLLAAAAVAGIRVGPGGLRGTGGRPRTGSARFSRGGGQGGLGLGR